MPRKKKVVFEIKTPKYVQIAEKDYFFACELFTRLNIEYVEISTSEEDIDYIKEVKNNKMDYGLS